MLRKTRWLWLAVGLLVAGGAGAGTAYAQTSVSGSFRSGGSSISISYFYDSLAPYGSWTNYGSYGYVWSPNRVASSWRPYSDGYWAYTDYGWTWVDNQPWGWGPMHYGRWMYADNMGWIWVPGTVWAPAWVAWSSYDNYVGWAPLPPDMGWNANVSVSFTNFDVHRLPSRDWCFVDRRDLTSSNLRSRILPVSRNATIYPRATNMTRFTSRNGAPVNVGVDVRTIEKASGRSVPRMRFVDAQRPGNHRVTPSRDQLQMFRGRFAPAPANAAPRMKARTDTRSLRGDHNATNPSASAARNQERQRVDLNQVRNNTRQPRPAVQSRQPARAQVKDAQAPRNRNGYPQGTIEQPRQSKPGDRGAAPANRGGGKDGGQRDNKGQGSSNDQPKNDQPKNDQPKDQHGNGKGGGRGGN